MYYQIHGTVHQIDIPTGIVRDSTQAITHRMDGDYTSTILGSGVTSVEDLHTKLKVMGDIMDVHPERYDRNTKILKDLTISYARSASLSQTDYCATMSNVSDLLPTGTLDNLVAHKYHHRPIEELIGIYDVASSTPDVATMLGDGMYTGSWLPTPDTYAVKNLSLIHI